MESFIATLIHYKALIGAVAGILEALVVLINVWKKFVSTVKGEAVSTTASPSAFKAFLWVINPMNVFRKPQ